MNSYNLSHYTWGSIVGQILIYLGTDIVYMWLKYMYSPSLQDFCETNLSSRLRAHVDMYVGMWVE